MKIPTLDFRRRSEPLSPPGERGRGDGSSRSSVGRRSDGPLTPVPSPPEGRGGRALRSFRVVACLALLNLSVPGGALVAFGVPLRESAERALAQRAKDAKSLASRRAKSASRLLTAEEERSLQGRAGENPYLAGQSKWDVVYKGVNLMTGNFSTSANDLSFDGGYGIPVNVTRSYSANNADEGPFGKGWTLSADVRSTAGGLLKSGSAPVRSVPTSFKERPSLQDDPNVAVEPAEAAIAIDAGGQEETIQKDVDGILTTPPWDKNVIDSTYEWVEFPVGSGQKIQVLASNTVKTPEGTVYTYAKKGTYPYGTVPWNATGATPEAANILKVTSATDRQGNVTTYTYGLTDVTFSKANGIVNEKPLTSVSMPGGHVITFVWGNGTNAPANRIRTVSDNGNARTATYGYDASGMLTSVTSPGGKMTAYGYGSAYGGGATNLLTSVTDPRGLTTTIKYLVAEVPCKPYNVPVTGVVAYGLIHPNGTSTYFQFDFEGHEHATPTDQPNFGLSAAQMTIGTRFGDFLGTGASATWVQGGGVYCYPTFAGDVFTVFLNDLATSVSAPVPVIGLSFNALWSKEYALANQDLVREGRRTRRARPDGNRPSRGFPDPYWVAQLVETTKSYNFMGQPLAATTVESSFVPSGGNNPNPVQSIERTSQVAYAYWGVDKYYQQKAVRTGEAAANYRYSFTDYFTSSALPGKRGQTYRVYDSKHGGIGLNAGNAVPTGTPSGNVWRYQVGPVAAQYSAEFAYDAQGRPTLVKKLQKTTPAWAYVLTQTTYGADGGNGGTWGQASQVVEDYGGINRTTRTLDYTSWGKASRVRDAKGQEFLTAFDGDGLVQGVTRVDGGTQAVVSYTYGTSGVENGQPLTVTDGLSGVAQTISYAQSGGGRGMPASVTETNGTDVYTVGYAYGPFGDRTGATYATPSGTARWGYADYNWVGDPTAPGRVFQTLRKLDASGSPTGEEAHYDYDNRGRLLGAAFAQSPQAGFSPGAGQPYYDASHPASRRARALYRHDAGGRLRGVEHYWDAQGQPSEAVLANECGYELGTGLNRGLKTSSSFYVKSTSNPAQFAPERTETFGYDALNDWLTEAHYADGNLDPNPTRAYDAAGNRSDMVVDNLNRATTLYPGFTATNDILGNRTSKTINGNTFEFGWDCLSRMVSHGRSTGANPWLATYAYRADGMRVSKSVYGKATRYRHDGQMGIEDVETSSAGTTVTRYGLGARGIDMIERTDSGGTMVGFPVYDAHGNMVATLSRSGTSGYSVGDRRIYSAWGDIRGSQVTGDPKGRYCANLGHKADDESGMVYMRARYYEPTTGRFVSEDPAMDGSNWFVYCGNDPINYSDSTGQLRDQYNYVFGMTAGVLGFLLAMAIMKGNALDGKVQGFAMGALAISVGGFCMALGETKAGSTPQAVRVLFGSGALLGIATVILGSMKVADAYGGIGGVAIIATAMYSTILLAALVNIAIDEGVGQDE